MEVLALYIYPIKSLPAIQIDQTPFDKDGFKFDRYFALYDMQGVMQTRRICKGMADFVLRMNGDVLTVYSNKLEAAIDIPCFEIKGSEMQLKVWDRLEQGLSNSPMINSFFSDHFGKALRLFSIHKEIDSFTSFHDDSPILVCNKESIRFLESKTDVKIDILRFRPNIITSSGTPFEEVKWSSLCINSLSFEKVKLCSRCIVINQEPSTAIVDLNVLKLIKPYTQSLFKVKFGLYIRPVNDGIINCRDKIAAVI